MNKPFRFLWDRDNTEAWFEVGDEVEINRMDDDEWEPAGKVIKVGSPGLNVSGIWYWLDGGPHMGPEPWPLHRLRPKGCKLTFSDWR